MMLAPDQRTLYIEAMQPPEGYQFDRGVGTTFTLDLMTLLIAPMSLALHEISTTQEGINDPILLLDSMQRFADRLTLFCQAGYIDIPDHSRYLYSYLENMVVEVQAPNGGVFHPKVWLLRYTSNGDAPIYRFLCLSRNLVFSRSWDVVLRLDGHLTDRINAFSRNHPLGDFVEALPSFATRKTSKRILHDVNLLQDEVRKVDFQVPYPFAKSSLAFHPMGHRSHRPFDFGDEHWRVLVISPFLTDALLREITEAGSEHVLFSEPESLARIGRDVVARFDEVLVFNDAVMNIPLDEESGGEELGGSSHKHLASPARLHAKAMVFEKGWDATWYIGSANATRSAWNGHNVEFMVELTGKKSKVGIDKVLGDAEDELSLRSMLMTFEPEEGVELDEEETKLENLLEQMRIFIVDLHLRARVEERDEDSFDFCLQASRKKNGSPQIRGMVQIWPISMPGSRAIEMPLEALSQGASFLNLSALALTSFVAFKLHAAVEDKKGELGFVLNLPVQGMPEQRDARIIAEVLSDPVQFIRYLRLILAEGVSWISPAWLELGQTETKGRPWRKMSEMGVPLLEDLVRAFSRAPEKIERIDEIIRKLEESDAGVKILSEEFKALWMAVQKARKEAL
jgi:hypothetical protein